MASKTTSKKKETLKAPKSSVKLTAVSANALPDDLASLDKLFWTLQEKRNKLIAADEKSKKKAAKELFTSPEYQKFAKEVEAAFDGMEDFTASNTIDFALNVSNEGDIYWNDHIDYDNDYQYSVVSSITSPEKRDLFDEAVCSVVDDSGFAESLGLDLDDDREKIQAEVEKLIDKTKKKTRKVPLKVELTVDVAWEKEDLLNEPFDNFSELVADEDTFYKTTYSAVVTSTELSKKELEGLQSYLENYVQDMCHQGLFFIPEALKKVVKTYSILNKLANKARSYDDDETYLYTFNEIAKKVK